MWQIGISGMGKNGFVNMELQKQQDTVKIIKTCEQLIEIGGMTADMSLKTACEVHNINFKNFLESEQEKITRKIEKIYKSKHNSDKWKN